MSEADQEVIDHQSHVRCTSCDKLLAKDLHNDCLQIKCPRCAELNVIHLNSSTTDGK